MKNNNDFEKRQSPRVEANDVIARYKVLDPRIWSIYKEYSKLKDIKNISRGGFAMETEDFIPVKSAIRIDLKLNEAEDFLATYGRVVWSKKEGASYKLGIAFSWWDKDDHKQKLEKFIKNKVS